MMTELLNIWYNGRKKAADIEAGGLLPRHHIKKGYSYNYVINGRKINPETLFWI